MSNTGESGAPVPVAPSAAVAAATPMPSHPLSNLRFFVLNSQEPEIFEKMTRGSTTLLLVVYYCPPPKKKNHRPEGSLNDQFRCHWESHNSKYWCSDLQRRKTRHKPHYFPEDGDPYFRFSGRRIVVKIIVGWSTEMRFHLIPILSFSLQYGYKKWKQEVLFLLGFMKQNESAHDRRRV